MGGGVLIAVVSILHVFVSHFAVGGGLWLVVTEMRANRTDDPELRGFVRKHSRFFMLLTLVFGAISGVGIWTTIGLVSPHGVSALIHGYVWGWAMEWVFFFIEIGAAIVYYYGWDKLSKKTHETIGWIYFISAWMSLVIINGIVTFMLTPGGWLENHDFWTGFFNPTYWPSTFIRTFGGIAIAGMFTLLTAANLQRSEFRWRVTRWNAGWAFFPMLAVIASAWWYGKVNVAEVWAGNEALLGAIPVLPTVVMLFKAGLVITLVLSLLPLLIPKAWNGVGVVLLLAAGWMAMGAGEWTREAGRKPFTIHGYLYSTGMLVDQEAEYEASGMLAGTKWISPEAADDPVRLGRDLFLAWCQPCHTMDGYNGLRPFLAHWNEETVASLVPRVGHMRALMPPWYGTEEESAAVAAYLMTQKPDKPAVLPADPVAGPAKAFEISCGLCHTPDGFRALTGSFTDMSAEEIDEWLDESGDMIDEMPGYFGTPLQREMLIRYLMEMDANADEDTETAAVTADEGSRS
jgi:mono/diheme cytochrome c family protein